MKLSECKIGVVVTEIKNDFWYHTHLTTDEPNIGHIVRLTKNSSGEVIPMVLWSTGLCETAIHHSDLELYKD